MMKQIATEIQLATKGDFSSGLFDCLSNYPMCCLTCWCPCITFGRIAEIVNQGSPLCGVSGAVYTLLMAFTGCHCVYSCINRSKLKAQYGMQENWCGDCCTHLLCEHCALCQEYRELQHRGYDVALGWHGNIERQNLGMISMMPPQMGGRMMR